MCTFRHNHSNKHSHGLRLRMELETGTLDPIIQDRHIHTHTHSLSASTFWGYIVRMYLYKCAYAFQQILEVTLAKEHIWWFWGSANLKSINTEWQHPYILISGLQSSREPYGSAAEHWICVTSKTDCIYQGVTTIHGCMTTSIHLDIRASILPRTIRFSRGALNLRYM